MTLTVSGYAVHIFSALVTARLSDLAATLQLWLRVRLFVRNWPTLPRLRPQRRELQVAHSARTRAEADLHISRTYQLVALTASFILFFVRFPRASAPSSGV